MSALTPRERRTMELVCEGYTAFEISQALCISDRTAEGHIVSAREKLGARNKTHAAVLFATQQSELQACALPAKVTDAEQFPEMAEAIRHAASLCAKRRAELENHHA